MADTHSVIWYLFGDERLSLRARQFIDEAGQAGDAIGISAISLAEIVYLEEKRRVAPGTLEGVLDALTRHAGTFFEIQVNRLVIKAMRRVSRDEVTDLPDIIIAASALLHDVPLVSRDQKIRLSAVQTIW